MRPLWIALLVPPVMTFVATFSISFASESGAETGVLLLGVPVVLFFVILMLTIQFHEIVNRRYQGNSLVFLTFAYFFGQIIVCLAIWIGSCALFMNSMRP